MYQGHQCKRFDDGGYVKAIQHLIAGARSRVGTDQVLQVYGVLRTGEEILVDDLGAVTEDTIWVHGVDGAGLPCWIVAGRLDLVIKVRVEPRVRIHRSIGFSTN